MNQPWFCTVSPWLRPLWCEWREEDRVGTVGTKHKDVFVPGDGAGWHEISSCFVDKSNNWGLTSWSSKKSFIIVMCVSCVCVGVHAIAHVRRSESNVLKSVLSVYLHTGSGDWVVVSTWTQQVSLPTIHLMGPKVYFAMEFQSLGYYQSLRIRRMKLPGGECDYRTPVMWHLQTRM